MRQSLRIPFQEFSQSVDPILRLMVRIQNESPAALREATIRAEHHTIQMGSVVLLSGYLESFLRNLCEQYFAELLVRGYGLQKLGSKFLAIHLREGAAHLTDIVKREGRTKAADLPDSSAFVRRLVMPIADVTKSPVWEAFARTQGNPSPDTIKKILGGLGVEGGFASIENALKKSYSAISITTYLESLNDLRNECAHTGTASTPPQPSTIIDLVKFMRLLTLAMCRLADLKITSLLATG